MAQGACFELSIASYAPPDLDVVELHGRERISSPSSFEVTVAVPLLLAEPFQSDALGAAARLTLRGGPVLGGAARRIHGVVAAVRMVAADPAPGWSWLTVQLVSRIRLLDHKKRNRIFHGETVPAIVAEVLGAAGIAHVFRLTRAYPPRPRCVQYDETDLELVTRLLAEEGIFYVIEDPSDDEAASEVVAFCDAAACYRPALGEGPGSAPAGASPDAPPLPFRPRTGMTGPAAVIEGFAVEDRLRPDAIQVTAFDHRRPLAKLSSLSTASGAAGGAKPPLLLHEHRFAAETGAPPLAADLLLEQVRADSRVGEGQSRSLALAPGRRFTLEDHPHDSLNSPYVVLEVRHEGRAPGAPGAPSPSTSVGAPGSPNPPEDVYRNDFLCLPAEVVARPPQPPRRLRQVLETATVVGPVAGPHGDEIHTDDLGCIKIRFHWDLDGAGDDAVSCWVRVVEPWAGVAWGSQFIPRVGMEVAVAFAGGDPDHPVALGALRDVIHPSPFPLPRSKTQSGFRTRSTPGGEGYSELSFDDAAGRERVHLRAQRDLDEVVGRDHRRTVGGDEVERIAGGRDVTIERDHVRTLRGDEVITIEQNLLLHVLGRLLLRVEGRPGPDEGAPVPQPPDGAPLPDGAPASADSQAGVDPGDPLSSTEPLSTPPIGGATFALPDETIMAAAALARRMLLAHVAQLPADLLPLGVAMEEEIDALANEVASLVGAVGEHARDEAARAAGSVPVGPVDPAAPPPATRATILKERARGSARAISVLLVELGGFTDPRLALVRSAAADCLRHALSDVAACALYLHREPTDTGGSPPAPTDPRRGGAVHGGGGAMKEHRTQGMSFQSADERGNPKMIETRGGSILEIEGGGKIVSRDGLKLEVGGCSIEMANGVVTITGDQVILNGKPIRLKGG